jgi:hypothetical protein
MEFLGLFYWLLIAFLITIFFSWLLRMPGPWGKAWTFFVVILMAVMAVGLWMRPMGPVYQDIYYMPPLVTGILVALLLAAATPSPRTRSALDRSDKKEGEREKNFYALGIFFWVLFVLMLVILAIGYFSANVGNNVVAG